MIFVACASGIFWIVSNIQNISYDSTRDVIYYHIYCFAHCPLLPKPNEPIWLCNYASESRIPPRLCGGSSKWYECFQIYCFPLSYFLGVKNLYQVLLIHEILLRVPSCFWTPIVIIRFENHLNFLELDSCSLLPTTCQYPASNPDGLSHSKNHLSLSSTAAGKLQRLASNHLTLASEHQFKPRWRTNSFHQLGPKSDSCHNPWRPTSQLRQFP